ncbi:MAG: TetR/AcrR family transcriptional regulator [Chloroflexota bacterium]
MPRADAGEERIGQIIDASLTVFAREGFARARIEDIAHEAGLAKGTLYLYFKSKDAIIASILKVVFRQELRLLRAHQGSDAPVSEQLRELTRQLAGSLDRMKPFLPIVLEFYSLAGRRPDVRQFLVEAFDEYRTLVAGLIRQGIDRGEFRSVDPDSVAITYTALFEGLALLWAVYPRGVDWKDQAEAAMGQLLVGIQIRDG